MPSMLDGFQRGTEEATPVAGWEEEEAVWRLSFHASEVAAGCTAGSTPPEDSGGTASSV
jgi:hypothetical protein